jgi:Xaa-Pro dipeptidase
MLVLLATGKLRISDKMVNTAISVSTEGVSERDIAASVHEVMVRAGGETPGFGPFIRSGERLPYEHEVWSERLLRRGDQVILEMAASVGRYHAPMGRLLYVGEAPEGTTEVENICLEAHRKTVEFMRPGVMANEVYATWQSVLDSAGLSHYRRHHCGYHVGIAFPPSWTGGIGVVSLHPQSDMVLQSGMAFHFLSWLLGCDRGDYFVSDTLIVTDEGSEILTSAGRNLTIV